MFRNNFSSSASLAWLLTFSAASSSLHAATQAKRAVLCETRGESRVGGDSPLRRRQLHQDVEQFDERLTRLMVHSAVNRLNTCHTFET
jgi:hypothetical protein